MTERPARPGADNPGVADATGRTTKRVIPKDAASLLLWRDGPKGVEVLMGRRHHALRFMPGVLVFPGGRVDRADYTTRPMSELSPGTRRMLEVSARPSLAQALAVAAARELHEETALRLGELRGDRLEPDLAPMSYLCRAITPVGRPLRFHARFLIAPADAARGTIQGSGELEELRFFPMDDLAGQPVMNITALILAEFRAWLALTPRKRATRTLIAIKGMDRRVPEKLTS